MVTERDHDDASDETQEPDNTLIQSGDEDGLDRTLQQGGGAATGSTPDGDVGEPTIPQQPVDATIPQSGASGADPKPARTKSPELTAPKTRTARRSSTEPSPDKPKIFAKRFEVIEKLGEGGMGVVYRARDRQIEGREIALKILRPRYSRNAHFRELFFKEIHAAQGFVSENVVQVRDTGKTEDGTLFLTMDLIAGEPLDGLLARETALHERHALEIARQTLLALASGHEQGFVHRDVKPQNVMLAARIPKTEDNEFGIGVRLLDFGIAGLAAQVEEGEIIGTPRYMSPEQVQGQRLDARSDLFAVGVVLYEMLAGSRPFEGTTPQEVSTAILETNITPLITRLDDLSEPIRKILRKALQKDRDKRFQSALDFVHAIEKSAAFKVKKGVPGWVAGALALSLAGAGAEGYLLWDLNKENLRLISEENKQLGIYQQSLREQGEDFRTRYDAVVAEREDFREKMTRAQAAAALANSDRQDAVDELETQRSEVARLRDEANRAKRERERFKEQLDALLREQLPEVAAARFFDGLLQRLANGSPDGALRYLETVDERGERGIRKGEGAAHVGHVVRAAAAFHEVAKLVIDAEGATVDAMTLDKDTRDRAFVRFREGLSQLQQAHASESEFVPASASWIGTKTILDQEREPDRLGELSRLRQRLDEEAADLGGRIETMKVRIDTEIEAEIESMMSLAFDDDPAALIAHLRNYAEDSEEFVPVVDRIGRDAEQSCVPSGAIDFDRLTKLDALEPWAEFLMSDDGRGLTSEGAQTLRWLGAARIWYQGRFLEPAKWSFLAASPDIESDVPHREWRSRLALQWQMGQRLDAFLREGARVTVHRHKLLRTGTLLWFQEELTKQPDDTWLIVRKRVDADGRLVSPQNLEVSLTKDRIYLADSPALDVRDYTASTKVALWKPQLVEPLPDQGWSRQMAHARFQERLQDGLPCLVYESGKARFWFAPGYGLVRQEVSGVFERELCFSDHVR